MPQNLPLTMRCPPGSIIINGRCIPTDQGDEQQAPQSPPTQQAGATPPIPGPPGGASSPTPSPGGPPPSFGSPQPPQPIAGGGALSGMGTQGLNPVKEALKRLALAERGKPQAYPFTPRR